jgi:hypothetical protein
MIRARGPSAHGPTRKDDPMALRRLIRVGLYALFPVSIVCAAGSAPQGAGTARCNVTGETPPGNRCQETFGRGFRRPFRFSMDPNAAGTRFFIDGVGQGAREEIDELIP